jgi:O-antigen ligase
MYLKVIRWWLTGIIFFLPFQRKIVKGLALWNNELSSIIGFLDEFTVVVFLPLAVLSFCKNGELRDRLYIILLLPILVFCISGFISGMKNDNNLIVTVLGLFDYIKNIIVIFIYAMFFKEIKYLKKIFRVVLIITIFLCFVAIIQELWAIINRYIISKDISTISYLLSEHRGWRFGFYRTSSLMHHPNMFALYTLLVFAVYVSMEKKIKASFIIPFCTGIITSISKVAYIGLIVVMAMRIFRFRKVLLILTLLATVMVIFSANFFFYINLLEKLEDEYYIFPSDSGMVSFRSYVRDRSLEIWKDYPLWGVGPGLYGGVVSIKYFSYIYEEYNFEKNARILISDFHSIDQFWPQLLVETGFAGFASFSLLFISLFAIFFMLRRRSNIDEVKGLFLGLIMFTVVIIIYTSVSGLNLTSNLFTYSALAGIGWGCSNKPEY